MRIILCYNTFIGGLSVIFTSNQNSTTTPVFNYKIVKQGDTVLKIKSRPMTPEEILWYNDLINNCYQMNIFEFIDNPTLERN